MKNFFEINRALVAKKKSILFLAAVFAATALQAEVVFNESHNVASWDAQQLPVADYPVLATAQAGDAIVITVTAVAEDARITLQSKDWKGWYDEYNVTVGKYAFVLTEATADSVRNGLIVTGQNYTFNKVELLYQKTIWSGLVTDNAGWAQSDQLNKSLFAGLAEGDILGVSVSAVNPGATWHQYVIRGREDDDIAWTHLEDIFTKALSEVATYTHVLTAAQATSLTQKNIDIAAQYLDVNALYTYTATKTTTAIDNTAVQQSGVKVLRDGVMYIRRGEILYNMQGQVVK
jgi:hypothetical protein